MRAGHAASRGFLLGQRRLLRLQGGHALLEWIIAAALGLAVLGGGLMLYRLQRETFSRSIDAATMREAGAAALTLVGQQIQMAGYAPVDEPVLRSRVTPGVFGCQSGRPDGRGVDEAACTHSRSDAADSDGIVARYVDDAVATWPSASGEPTDCLGQAVERHGEHAVIVNRFYVAKPERREARELYCAGNGARTPQPVVEGIERMVLHYWLRGAAEPVRARAVAPGQWSEVVAVDLCVVVRGQRHTVRHTVGTTFVDCDGGRVSSPDGRARLSLSRRVVLRNRDAAP